MVQAVAGNRRRLVLHFDINNTIVMKDLAKGLGTTDNVSRSHFSESHVAYILIFLGLSHSLQVSLGKAYSASRFTRGGGSDRGPVAFGSRSIDFHQA